MNILQNFFDISNLLVSLAIMISWVFLIVFIIVGVSLGYKYEIFFYRATIELLSDKKLNIDRYCEGIKSNYEVYKYHKLGFNYKKIVELCQETVGKIRLGKRLENTEYLNRNSLADKLDCVIKMLQNEESYDDEKANEIITILSDKIDANDLNKIRERLKFLEGFHKGISKEKDTQIENLKAKAKRKKGITWMNWVTGILGAVGSVFTIITFFMQ